MGLIKSFIAFIIKLFLNCVSQYLNIKKKNQKVNNNKSYINALQMDNSVGAKILNSMFRLS